MKYLLNDKIFYPAAAALALLLIVFSIIWPQGLGKPSPAPFGHAVVMPDYFRMIHDVETRRKHQAQEKAARIKAQAALKKDEASSSSSSSSPALRPALGH